MNGWYPDPGGEPGRYRYWDGRSWSAGTTDDPSRTAPTAGAVGPARRSRTIGVAVGILALVVLVVVVGFLFRGGVRAVIGEPIPSGSVSGGDDRSPTPSESGSDLPFPCPLGNPNERDVHPEDGRVYGGNLSFAAEPTFDPAAEEVRFSFAHDVIQQVYVVNRQPGWIAQLAVGEVRASDGFDRSAERTADLVVQCAVTSQLYLPYRPTRRDVSSKAVTVDGRAGWQIETDITVDSPGLPIRGDHTIFILVPDGNDWGLFFGAVPIGDADLAPVLPRAVASLRVS